MNKLYSIFFLVLTCACAGSTSHQKDTGFPNDSVAIQVIPLDEDALYEKLQSNDSSYLFITTDWCRGGNLTLNNLVLPYLDHLRATNTDYYILYFGELSQISIDTNQLESLGSLTIYTMDNFLMENSFSHKMRIREIVDEIDPEFDPGFKVPLSVLIVHNKVVKSGSLRKILTGK